MFQYIMLRIIVYVINMQIIQFFIVIILDFDDYFVFVEFFFVFFFDCVVVFDGIEDLYEDYCQFSWLFKGCLNQWFEVVDYRYQEQQWCDVEGDLFVEFWNFDLGFFVKFFLEVVWFEEVYCNDYVKECQQG